MIHIDIQMSCNFKCHYHSGNYIQHFQPCLLPMCNECLEIHVEDHQSSATQAQVLAFSEVSAQFDNHLKNSLSRLKRLSQRASQFSIQQRLKQCLTDISKARMIFIEKIQDFFEQISSQARQMAKSSALQFDVKSLSQQVTKLEDILKRNERCQSLRQLILYYSNDSSMQFDLFIEQSQTKISQLASFDPFCIEINPEQLQSSLNEFISFKKQLQQNNHFNRFSSQKSQIKYRSSKESIQPSPKQFVMQQEDHSQAFKGTVPQKFYDSHSQDILKFTKDYAEEEYHRVDYPIQTHKAQSQIHQAFRIVQGARQPVPYLLNQGQQNYQVVKNHVNYQQPQAHARHTYRVIHPPQQQVTHHNSHQFQRSNSHNSIRRPVTQPLVAPLETHFRGVNHDNKQIVYIQQGQQVPIFQHTPSKEIIIKQNQYQPHRFQLSPSVHNVIKPLQRPSSPLPPYQAQYPPQISPYIPLQSNAITKQFIHQTQPMIFTPNSVQSHNSQHTVNPRIISSGPSFNQFTHPPQKPFYPVIVQSESQNTNQAIHQNTHQNIHQKFHTVQQQFARRASTPIHNQPSRQTVPLTQRSMSQIKVQQQKFDTFAKAKLQIEQPKDREKLQSIINNLKHQTKESYSRQQSRRSSHERRQQNWKAARQEQQLRVDYLPVKQPNSSRRDYKFMFHKDGISSDLQLYHLQERIQNIRKQNEQLRRADS